MKIIIEETKNGITASNETDGSVAEVLGFLADAYVALDSLATDFIGKNARPDKKREAVESFFDTVEKHRREIRGK